MQKATAKWERKYCLLNSWVSTPNPLVRGNKMLGAECGLSPEEGSMRSPACYILSRCADNGGGKPEGEPLKDADL